MSHTQAIKPQPDIAVVRSVENSEMTASQGWYQAAARTAMVAAVFCGVVLLLLTANAVKSRAYDPLKAPKLLKRQLGLNRDPQNASLQAEVRQLDREMRTAYFQGRKFAVQGYWLLLGGAVVFLLSLEGVRALRPAVPVPLPSAVEEAVMGAVKGRRGVVIVGIAGTGLLLTLTVLSRHDLAAEYAKAVSSGSSLAVSEVPVASMAQTPPPLATGLGTLTTAPPPVTNTNAPQSNPMVSSPGNAALSVVKNSAKPVAPANSGIKTVAPVANNSASTSAAGNKAGPVLATPMSSPMMPLLPAGGETQWSAFRGGSGVSAITDAPTAWDAKTGQGILWKVAVPLPGMSSPVVWKDRLFLTGADATNRAVFCFSTESGSLFWKTMLPPQAAPPVKVQTDTGYAPATVATDGKNVCATFPDGLVVCVDFAGGIRWKREMGRPENPFGHAASPVIYSETLIVPFDQGKGEDTKKSRLYALSLADGKTVWETPRPVTSSWASPLLVKAGEQELLVLSANPWVIGYDPKTGKERWRAQCMSGDVAPSPVFGGGWVFACNQGAALVAIRPDGTGDVTKTHIGWKFDESVPDIASPVSDGAFVYLALGESLVVCVDAKTGKKAWDYETGAPVHSSPLVIGNTLYVTDTEGTTHLLATGGTLKPIGKAAVGEEVNATPAVAHGKLYVRGKQHLFCIGAN